MLLHTHPQILKIKPGPPPPKKRQTAETIIFFKQVAGADGENLRVSELPNKNVFSLIYSGNSANEMHSDQLSGITLRGATLLGNILAPAPLPLELVLVLVSVLAPFMRVATCASSSFM